MKKKIYNEEHIQGRIYQHDLVVKTVKNKDSRNFGNEYITGDIEVAVDEKGLNVLKVHYQYVSEFNASGSRNSNFPILKKIIDEGRTWLTDGKDNATKVKIDTALALNDFYDINRGEHVSVLRNEGGFIDIVNSICGEDEIDRHKFVMDMLITGARRVESEDPEVEPKCVVKGAVFNYKNEILPVEFAVRDPNGMSYFESLDVNSKNPMFVKLWGAINSVTTRTKKEEQSAFGMPSISFVEKTVKEWTITGVSPEPYQYGDPNILTEEEVTKAMQDREIKLANIKKDREDWQTKKNSSANTPSTSSFASGNPMNVPVGGFNF